MCLIFFSSLIMFLLEQPNGKASLEIIGRGLNHIVTVLLMFIFTRFGISLLCSMLAILGSRITFLLICSLGNVFSSLCMFAYAVSDCDSLDSKMCSIFFHLIYTLMIFILAGWEDVRKKIWGLFIWLFPKQESFVSKVSYVKLWIGIVKY